MKRTLVSILFLLALISPVKAQEPIRLDTLAQGERVHRNLASIKADFKKMSPEDQRDFYALLQKIKRLNWFSYYYVTKEKVKLEKNNPNIKPEINLERFRIVFDAFADVLGYPQAAQSLTQKEAVVNFMRSHEELSMLFMFSHKMRDIQPCINCANLLLNELKPEIISKL